LRARVDADDILQETFLAANRRLGHYAKGPYTSPFLWLRAILTQTLIDVHRRHVGAQMRAPEREVPLDAPQFPQATSTALAIQLVGNATSPGEAAARADMMAMMEKAIADMDSIDQEVLALRHFEELSNREVADILSITQKTASIRYVRALRRLRVILAEKTGFFRQSH
ncbi:MAG: sigma-70 family RNA polymerase sigma factor, partial [Lentisphaerae bacterium]|nr:sigma-70 family RNA polymerase sigma factor [Lentisphaerota bacterium]